MRSLEILGLKRSSQSGSAVTATPPKLSMFTDASNFGWAAHVNEANLTMKGTWSQEESKRSINILELKAVLLVVKHFRHCLRTRECPCFHTTPH
jgi:hypothetical protein